MLCTVISFHVIYNNGFFFVAEDILQLTMDDDDYQDFVIVEEEMVFIASGDDENDEQIAPGNQVFSLHVIFLTNTHCIHDQMYHLSAHQVPLLQQSKKHCLCVV